MQKFPIEDIAPDVLLKKIGVQNIKYTGLPNSMKSNIWPGINNN